MSKVELVIRPQVKDLGDNFEVRRSLPDRRKRMVGPFIFWDHMGPVTLMNDKNMKVRAHPHIGLATITWLFSGEIMHRDSLGNEQPILPGEVNWMTAGKGITHSERASAKPNQDMVLEGIQLWLALPKDKEDIDPSFFHCKESDIPQIEEKDRDIKVIAGNAFGIKSPVPTYSSLFYLNVNLQSGAIYKQQVSANHEAAIYVVDGEIELEGQSYRRFDLIILKKDASIELVSNQFSKIMIFGGEVFPEKRHIWWNFVSTSKDKIEQAKEKWKNGEFEKVINENESIELPEL